MLRSSYRTAAALLAAGLTVTVLAEPKDDFRPFKDVAEGYEQVVSTADGKPSLYGVWINKKDQQVLAELPRGWERQKHFVAVTQASGGVFAGLQGPARYVYWKRYGDRIALMEPELETRSTGEPESKSSVERLFTDRVLVDVPIVCMGPGGQPVIDLDDLLVKQVASLAGRGRAGVGGVNHRLATVANVKAFPENIEIAFEAPSAEGRLVTVHYSISNVPENSSYKPRAADERVGYFTTVYRDLGTYDNEKKWVRYIDRWHLEKRDPKLNLSPPKEPIVFHLEHTVPVRYRRWIRQGVEYWNDAFRKVGLDNAIEVRIQDAGSGAHMDKDPEDVRYNFIRWLNNDISTAIGPHRAHPLTGQILDADVVLTDGWIRAYWGWYHEMMPQLAVQSFTPETLAWLDEHPEWDPRILLAPPSDRPRLRAASAARLAGLAAGEVPEVQDPLLAANPELGAIAEWVGHDAGHCLAAHGMAFDMAVARLTFEAFDPATLAPEGASDQLLDGIPEWFVGPLLAELTAHEVGHTLGLRHNFKASSLYTLEEINSEEFKGTKPLAGSVMDYLPANFNMESGEIQGDFTMIDIGPYDRWAIEYGYTFGDLEDVLARVAEPELAYLTDDDTSGPDPFARRYDFSADPLAYAESQIRIARHHRERLLDSYVKDGDSWSKARDGYRMTLNLQARSLSMMANWVGGAHVNRDRKGDPDGRRPVEVVDAERQREALVFLIDNAFEDDAFGLSPALLAHMTVDKWSDQSPGDRSDPTWPVHDVIMGIQASTLTMIMNPSTLARVYDNEYRVPADEDAMTLPEVMEHVTAAAYRELDTDLDGDTYTPREPMISSFRRNLQSSMTDRLIALSTDDPRMPRPIRTLALHHLRETKSLLESVLEKRDRGQIDQYTIAHIEDLDDRIGKALERTYVEPM